MAAWKEVGRDRSVPRDSDQARRVVMCTPYIYQVPGTLRSYIKAGGGVSENVGALTRFTLKAL